MKEFIKKALRALGLYSFATRYYHMYQHFSTERLRLQFHYRFHGAPDGYPVPPPRMVHKIIARGWAEQYWIMGKEETEEIIDILKSNDIDPSGLSAILDFGCGCGRLIRHFLPHTGAKLYGSDYNAKLVKWCARKLKFGEFGVNKLAPPLQYEDEFFDFIYLISVFTHLGPELQRTWIDELRRILRSGGYLLFTTHGDRFFSFFNDEQLESFRAGEFVIIEEDSEGTNHYGSFESTEYVKKHLLKGFELVDFIRGKADLDQDTYLVRKL
jgi:SAM-dependent methyltransferase